MAVIVFASLLIAVLIFAEILFWGVHLGLTSSGVIGNYTNGSIASKINDLTAQFARFADEYTNFTAKFLHKDDCKHQ
jgi:hypothetical protein